MQHSPHSSYGTPQAASAPTHYQAAITSITHWRADAMRHIDTALHHDPDYPEAHLIKGWMLHGAGNSALAATISSHIASARHAERPLAPREHQLLLALELANRGLGSDCASVLESLLQHNPQDLLVHQLAQEETFWLGRSDWMHKLTETAAPAWTADTPGYGQFLSLRAFASEEAGYLQQAEKLGRMAVEIDAADVWGAHAVAHVLFMQGKAKAGIDWLEALSPNWHRANQMRHHLWWHICLFLLDTGQHDRILQLLTTEIRNPESALVQSAPAATIDITNLASLLMRLELYGVDVEQHWQTLADICAARVNSHGSAFANVHDIMVLAATGQFDKATQMLQSMRDCYHQQTGSTATAYNSVGIIATEAMLAHRRQAYPQLLQKLGGIRHQLALMGASHAQRDVFYHMLVDAAARTGQQQLLASLLREIEQIGLAGIADRAAYRDHLA